MDIEKGPIYKWYVLGVLTMVYVFNFIDRQILVILAEPIKSELDLSDTQLGLLTGLAFAALYIILGIPIARYADMHNRKNIVALSLVVWSSFTALSGRVQDFMQLFLARIGVGVGEAGCSPPAHAIISDYFPPEKRSTALSIYSMGIFIGVFLGYTFGGIIAAQYGWRVAFYAIGIPGILFALVVYFTVKEPIKGKFDRQLSISADNPSLGEVIRELLGKKTFLYIALGAGFNAFVTYGIGNFVPSFLIRVHGFDIQTIGISIGLAMGLGGSIGSYFGGYISDKLRSRDLRWYMYIPIIGGLLNIIPSLILIFTGSGQVAIVMVFFTSMFSAFYLGCTIAATHSLVTAKMRAFSSSILFFILNLIGLGFGPLMVGYLSDLLQPSYGSESLRYAFLVTVIAGFISIAFFYMGSKSYIKELNEFTDRLEAT